MSSPPTIEPLAKDGAACLHRLSESYVWWKSADEAMRFPQRVAALVMNLGSWDDLTSLSEALGEEYLRTVLRQAEPGQFNQRSWRYWHYRLGLAEYGARPVPPLPERRFS